MARRSGAAGLLLVLLVGCGGTTSTSTTSTDSDRGVARLGAAVSALSPLRAAALDSARATLDAARALDATDVACATGRPDAAQQVRPTGAARTNSTALRAAPARLTAYRNGLDELAAATTAAAVLTPAQVSALDQVVSTGRSEAAALVALPDEVERVWPTYATLDGAQRTWLERRTAGWYRNVMEAANAYAVLTDAQRPALAAARQALASRDAARSVAGQRQSAALQAADTALAPLR